MLRAGARRLKSSRLPPAKRYRRALVSRPELNVYGHTAARGRNCVPSARSASIERAASQFCYKADQRIERQHNRDCAALLPFPKIKRQNGCGAQQVDHWALELMQQHAEGGNLPMHHNRIWPISLEPARQPPRPSARMRPKRQSAPAPRRGEARGEARASCWLYSYCIYDQYAHARTTYNDSVKWPQNWLTMVYPCGRSKSEILCGDSHLAWSCASLNCAGEPRWLSRISLLL